MTGVVGCVVSGAGVLVLGCGVGSVVLGFGVGSVVLCDDSVALGVLVPVGSELEVGGGALGAPPHAAMRVVRAPVAIATRMRRRKVVVIIS